MIKKRFRSNILVLFIALAAPIAVYAVFELTSLTADERELEEIYQRQLEAVLFSINQYTQDVVGGVANKIDNAFQYWNQDQVDGILKPYKFFRAMDLRDVTGKSQLFTSNEAFLAPSFALLSDSVYNSSDAMISRLTRYKQESGYQKIEPLDFSVAYKGEPLDLIQFMVGSGENIRFATYYISGRSFIDQILVPKIQEISQGEFVIICQNKQSGEVVYSNIELNDQEVNSFSEQLDLLPQYEIGIARTGSTIEEAVGKRKAQNLTALGLLLSFLLLGIVLVMRNIRKEMELAQNKADFVSNVSHEIRTPLALISMFAETLLMDRVKGEAKKKEYYEIITKEVARLTNMVNRILSFSKIEANKREYHKSEQCLDAITKEVINTYSYHLESQGFVYTYTSTQKLPPIYADKEAIIEVLVNLIDNAMKYSKDTKEVNVSTGLEENKVFVKIQDKGIGIPKGQLEKLFDKFYRVHTGDVHDAKGSGLGLTIVKHIMDAHEGEIQLDSTLGEGSTFTLLFPIFKSNYGTNLNS